MGILGPDIMQKMFHGYDILNIYLPKKLDFNPGLLKERKLKLALVSKRTLKYYVIHSITFNLVIFCDIGIVFRFIFRRKFFTWIKRAQ